MIIIDDTECWFLDFYFNISLRMKWVSTNYFRSIPKLSTNYTDDLEFMLRKKILDKGELIAIIQLRIY